MATSYSGSGVCEVVEEQAISGEDMRGALAAFLRKEHVRKGLSKDDYTKLSRFQKALEDELKSKNHQTRLPK